MTTQNALAELILHDPVATGRIRFNQTRETIERRFRLTEIANHSGFPSPAAKQRLRLKGCQF